MRTMPDSHFYRGMLQSKDGVISEIIRSDKRSATFLARFELTKELADRLKAEPEHMVFSERSRIARLGVQMRCDPIDSDSLEDRTLTLRLTAMPFISRYPGMDMLAPFFTPGFPVGRLLFCDPEALLSADAVMDALESARIKLPASTSISSSGGIVIAPHKVVCRLRDGMTPELLSRILLDADGREILNRRQIQEKVSAIILPPADGVITTCSMYLNEHYVMLQSGSELGRQFAATVLDPIKTRGVRIYLEIANETDQPIVNPLISARIYSAKKSRTYAVSRPGPGPKALLDFEAMKKFEVQLDQAKSPNCHLTHRPVAVMPKDTADFSHATIYTNGPPGPCQVKPSVCASAARDFSPKSPCPHVYGTSKVKIESKGESRCW